MHSLLLRFFLSFWLIIAITIGTAGVGGYLYAERLRDAMESIEIGESMLDASAALETGGRDGLAKWVKEFPTSRAVTIFALDERGHDILERSGPYRLSRMFRRHRQHLRTHEFDDNDPRNLRRSRPHPQLVATDGRVYTFFVSPSRSSQFFWSREDARWLLFVIALVVSGIVSWFLATTMSRPVPETW